MLVVGGEILFEIQLVTEYKDASLVVGAKVPNDVFQGGYDCRTIVTGQERSFDQNAERDRLRRSRQTLGPVRRMCGRCVDARRLAQGILKTEAALGLGNRATCLSQGFGGRRARLSPSGLLGIGSGKRCAAA